MKRRGGKWPWRAGTRAAERVGTFMQVLPPPVLGPERPAPSRLGSRRAKSVIRRVQRQRQRPGEAAVASVWRLAPAQGHVQRATRRRPAASAALHMQPAAIYCSAVGAEVSTHLKHLIREKPGTVRRAGVGVAGWHGSGRGVFFFLFLLLLHVDSARRWGTMTTRRRFALRRSL